MITCLPVLSVSFEVVGWGKDVGGWKNEHPRREPLGGSGGMLPQESLKSRCSEMPFSAFSNRYFPLKWQSKLNNKTLLVIVILTESTFFIISSGRFRKKETQSVGIHDVLNAQGFAMHYRAILNRSSHFDFRCERVLFTLVWKSC